MPSPHLRAKRSHVGQTITLRALADYLLLLCAGDVKVEFQLCSCLDLRFGATHCERPKPIAVRSLVCRLIGGCASEEPDFVAIRLPWVLQVGAKRIVERRASVQRKRIRPCELCVVGGKNDNPLTARDEGRDRSGIQRARTRIDEQIAKKLLDLCPEGLLLGDGD